MDNFSGIKELYDVSIRLNNPIEFNGRKFDTNETLLIFKTAEIAENLGLKDTRTKELLKELVGIEKLVDNGKTKGKMYKLK